MNSSISPTAAAIQGSHSQSGRASVSTRNTHWDTSPAPSTCHRRTPLNRLGYWATTTMQAHHSAKPVNSLGKSER